MGETVLLPKCDPEEAGFRIKDYFTDLEAYFVALKIENTQKRSFLQLSMTKLSLHLRIYFILRSLVIKIMHL